MQRRWFGAAALGTAALVGGPMAGLASAQTTPAPPSESTAVAINVNGVAAVGRTGATSGPGGGQAGATALELGGKPVVSQAGGTQKGDGESKGAVLDTGTTPLGGVQVAPWRAKVAGNRSEADAALLRFFVLGPNVVRASVLESTSSTDYTTLLSRSRGTSDGAKVNVGGDALAVVLLHSESDSSGTGKTYVASINGNEILTQKDSKTCTLAVPSAVALACLSVSGGAGSVAAQTAGAAVGPNGSVLTAQALSSGARAGTGTAAPAPAAPGGIELPRDLGDGPADGPSELARTGWQMGGIAAAALALVLLGSGVVTGARRSS